MRQYDISCPCWFTGGSPVGTLVCGEFCFEQNSLDAKSSRRPGASKIFEPICHCARAFLPFAGNPKQKFLLASRRSNEFSATSFLNENEFPTDQLLIWWNPCSSRQRHSRVSEVGGTFVPVGATSKRVFEQMTEVQSFWKNQRKCQGQPSFRKSAPHPRHFLDLAFVFH